MNDEKIRKALSSMTEEARVPDFQQTWNAAKRAKGDGGTLRWLLGPALAAAAVATIIALVFHTPSPEPASPELLASLATLAVPDAGTLPMDEAQEGLWVVSAQEERAQKGLSLGLFVGQTDFLVNMDSPAWGEKGKSL